MSNLLAMHIFKTSNELMEEGSYELYITIELVRHHNGGQITILSMLHDNN